MRTLFVKRNVLNGNEIIEWAKGVGIPTTLPRNELHVTQFASNVPVDWELIPFETANVTDAIRLVGGIRTLVRLGPAIAITFYSPTLLRRFEDFKKAGFPFVWDEYITHVSVTYDNPDFDIAGIPPYTGDIVLGSEILGEFDSNHKPTEI